MLVVKRSDVVDCSELEVEVLWVADVLLPLVMEGDAEVSSDVDVLAEGRESLSLPLIETSDVLD